MSGVTLGSFDELWQAAVANHSEKSFLTFLDETGVVSAWTYSEFGTIVDRTVSSLASLGVQPGGTVHTALRNCPGFVALWLACVRMGATFVPVDPASRPRDLHNQIIRIRPQVAVCAADRASDYSEALAEAKESFPVLELTESAMDVTAGGGLVGGDTAGWVGRRPEPEDRLAIMFTSGTTSAPKGVVLTQQNYRTVAETMAHVVDLQERHRWLVVLPMFHANAQYYCFAPAIKVGASVSLVHAFSASRWVRQANELEATHASLFAAPMRMILARTPEAETAQLEHVWFAQSIGAEHYEQFAQVAGVRPRQLYGMTETVACVTADSSDPLRNDIIGHPVGNRVVRVEAPAGEQARVGETGMLCVRGRRGMDLFREYLDDEATTGRSFTAEDGWDWFRTGDLVSRDNAGRLHYVGRADDVIKVSGENVSLTEVEAVVAQAPGIIEACVVGRADEIRDMVPVAYVVPRDNGCVPDVRELEEYAHQNLAPQSRPREWHVVDNLPRTSVGKIRRFALKADGQETIS